jgi:hypothetical protein
MPLPAIFIDAKDIDVVTGRSSCFYGFKLAVTGDEDAELKRLRAELGDARRNLNSPLKEGTIFTICFSLTAQCQRHAKPRTCSKSNQYSFL